MEAFYAEIRLVHIGAALAGGALFLARGMARFGGAPAAVLAPLRYLHHAVDTVLLTAALMLMTIVRQYPFVDGWLTAKVVLLAVYVALGVAAFRDGGGRAGRVASWAAAAAIYAFVYSVARARHPLGVLDGLMG